MNTQVVQYQPAVENYGSRSLTAADVRAQVNLVQDVMREVMIEGTHYGKIPGTNGKSLWKAGAEKLMATFRLGAKPRVEDLSQGGEIHYRVFVSLVTANGDFVGEGLGECSSQEDKYAWRAAVNQKEFDATPENRRRIKFTRNNGDVKQVRTNPADVGNTILKMAKKRAQVDAVITCTAASDIFTQDIEDLPDEVVAELVGAQMPRASAAASAAVQQTVPVNSQERTEAMKEAEGTARKGTAAFHALWKDWPREKRLLVADQMSHYKNLAEIADARLQDERDAVDGGA